MVITILFTVLIIVSTYCIGSISSAIVICKTIYALDPRDYGSKNPGATNIFRIAGYKLALSVVILDFLKGAIPIYTGQYLEITSIDLQIIVISVCIGHMYPIFFQFNGGKGVATAFGALTAINMNWSIIMIITWLSIILIFRYVSLGSIVTAIIMPFYVWLMQPQYLTCMILVSFLILVRHISNIKRLFNHQEKQI